MSAVTASLGEAGELQVQSASVLGLGWRSEMYRYPPIWLEAQPGTINTTLKATRLIQ